MNSKQRLKICKDCKNYHKIFKTCKLCQCFMPIKVKLTDSICPINKWK